MCKDTMWWYGQIAYACLNFKVSSFPSKKKKFSYHQPQHFLGQSWNQVVFTALKLKMAWFRTTLWRGLGVRPFSMSSDPTILTVGQTTEVEATLAFMNSTFRKTYPVCMGLRLTSASKCLLTYETFPCFLSHCRCGPTHSFNGTQLSMAAYNLLILTLN